MVGCRPSPVRRRCDRRGSYVFLWRQAAAVMTFITPRPLHCKGIRAVCEILVKKRRCRANQSRATSNWSKRTRWRSQRGSSAILNRGLFVVHSTVHSRAGTRRMSADVEAGFRDSRFSAPRSHGKRASRMAMLSAAVASNTTRNGTTSGRVARSARRARWLRLNALPPRAPWRRSCSGDVLKV